MADPLEFTGERYLPGTLGEIAHEHWHRYAFARRFVAGLRVLDAACGEGYGSALLADVAAEVVGLDVDAAAVAHARARYGQHAKLSFVEGSATAIPLAAGSVGAIVSFETLEHLPAEAQPRMIAEFARVLAPGGTLILSSPNRPQYSEARGYVNPFHLHELDRDELAALLGRGFTVRQWFRQRRWFGSALWAERGGDGVETLAGDAQGVGPAALPEAMYFVVVASRGEAAARDGAPALSLFGDRGEESLAWVDTQASEVMRLDGLLKERDDALAARGAHVLHLEGLVAARERLVVQRDGELAARDAALTAAAAREAALVVERDRARHDVAALDDERGRLERAVTAQERIIAYRQSLRWWLALPFLRVKLLWHRMFGT